jgi:predicted HAD superfamily Cof-like phosphohydrolase
MIDMIASVKEFWEAGLPDAIGIPKGQQLAMKLIEEEYNELRQAFNDGSREHIADGIVDLLYVTIGLAVAMRLDLEPLFRAVHEYNMLKARNPRKRPDGKLMKPEGVSHPNIGQLLSAQENDYDYE